MSKQEKEVSGCRSLTYWWGRRGVVNRRCRVLIVKTSILQLLPPPHHLAFLLYSDEEMMLDFGNALNNWIVKKWGLEYHLCHLSIPYIKMSSKKTCFVYIIRMYPASGREGGVHPLTQLQGIRLAHQLGARQRCGMAITLSLLLLPLLSLSFSLAQVQGTCFWQINSTARIYSFHTIFPLTLKKRSHSKHKPSWTERNCSFDAN